MPRCSELHHISKLTHVQIVVEAFLRKQLRCIALLDDAAVVDDEDPVGLLDRGKAVCDGDDGFPSGKFCYGILDQMFIFRVNTCGRLIQKFPVFIC